MNKGIFLVGRQQANETLDREGKFRNTLRRNLFNDHNTIVALGNIGTNDIPYFRKKIREVCTKMPYVEVGTETAIAQGTMLPMHLTAKNFFDEMKFREIICDFCQHLADRPLMHFLSLFSEEDWAQHLKECSYALEKLKQDKEVSGEKMTCFERQSRLNGQAAEFVLATVLKRMLSQFKSDWVLHDKSGGDIPLGKGYSIIFDHHKYSGSLVPQNGKGNTIEEYDSVMVNGNQILTFDITTSYHAVLDKFHKVNNSWFLSEMVSTPEHPIKMKTLFFKSGKNSKPHEAVIRGHGTYFYSELPFKSFVAYISKKSDQIFENY